MFNYFWGATGLGSGQKRVELFLFIFLDNLKDLTKKE